MPSLALLIPNNLEKKISWALVCKKMFVSKYHPDSLTLFKYYFEMLSPNFG
jgi:hypothetical protein